MSEDRRQESALEEFLERRSRVSRAYRDAASGEQPPAALDDAILAASRRAVGSGPRRLGWTRRWGTPLAAAAVIVLAIAVVFNLQDEPQIAQFKESAAPPAPEREGTAEARVKASERDAADLAKAGGESKTELRARTAEKSSAPRSILAQPSASTGRVMGDTASAPAAPAQPLADQLRADRAATEPAAGEIASRSAATGFKADEQAKTFASGQELARTEHAKAAEGVRKQSAASAPAAATAIPPETLLKDIETLYAQGRTEEGDRALREFCRSFPAYALPQGLGRHASRLGLDCAPRK